MRSGVRRWTFVLAVCSLVLPLSCGTGTSTGKSGASNPTLSTGPTTTGGSPVPITITASGASTLPAGGTLQLSASFPLVQWQVNGISGGNPSLGTISSSGLYTAPACAQVSAPMTVTVTAMPTLGSGSAGSTTLTIVPATIAITPSSVTMFAGRTQQFHATLANTSETAVIWFVNDVLGGNGFLGTVSATGLYSAPFPYFVSQTITVRVTAALAANSNIASTAQVAVSPEVAVNVTPATTTVAAGGQRQFLAAVANNSNPAVTWLVNGTSGGDATAGTITATGLYTAPLGGAVSANISAVSQADPYSSGSAIATVLSPHAIAVRSGGGLAEFYRRAGGQTFTPRGNNYVRLGLLTDSFGRTQIDHTTFISAAYNGTNLYDAARAEAALAAMEANGYNFTRIFLNGCCVGGSGNDQGTGLNSAYIANVVGFLNRAKAHHIQVVLTQDWPPSYGGYGSYLGPCWPQFDMNNLQYLSSCGVQANATYFHDLVQALIVQAAPLDTVFSYELRSEYSYDAAYGPLNLTSGAVTAANGKAYDLGDAASRQAMLDEGLVYWVDHVSAPIRQLDPTAMVTIGFFAPQGPNPYRVGDERLIQPWPAVAASSADYVSIHPYPIPAWAGGLDSLDAYVQNFGFVGYQQKQPVVMEEFGAFVNQYDEATAATLLRDWQVAGCAYNIKGWMFWTWDTDPSEQAAPATWPAFGGTGVINSLLAPATRPDPCVP